MPKKRRTVVLATNSQLDEQSYRNRLKTSVSGIGLGEREWPTTVQDMLLHADMRGIDIRYASGKRFVTPLVDDVWKDERYIRVFLASERCVHPEKDRLIDLYFRVMMPDIARHFSR